MGNYANKINGTIKQFNTLPFGWKGVENVDCYYETRTDLHELDGFYPLVYPEITEYQKYDSIDNATFDGRTYTMIVLDKSEEQIEAEELEKAIVEQDELVAKNMKMQVIQNAQVYDDADALNNKALYLQWQYPVNYDKDFKVQAFSEKALKKQSKGKATKASTELLLYKCLQPHTSQVDWQPSETPSLWVEISEDGTIPVWKQPTGAHDAYNKGRQVHYPTDSDPIYESTVDANVYAPGVVAGQWLKI